MENKPDRPCEILKIEKVTGHYSDEEPPEDCDDDLTQAVIDKTAYTKNRQNDTSKSTKRNNAEVESGNIPSEFMKRPHMDS